MFAKYLLEESKEYFKVNIIFFRIRNELFSLKNLIYLNFELQFK